MAKDRELSDILYNPSFTLVEKEFAVRAHLVTFFRSLDNKKARAIKNKDLPQIIALEKQLIQLEKAAKGVLQVIHDVAKSHKDDSKEK